MERNAHHLVLGERVDFLSQKVITDTHDELYHQKLARQLVLDLGYKREDITQKHDVVIRAGDQTARIKVSFLVGQKGQWNMMVRYAPGSLVTRRVSNLALSRIICPYQIPVIVSTNGEDAEVVCGRTGKVIGEGLRAIPGPSDQGGEGRTPKVAVSAQLFEKASRIAFAFEVDGACPCDSGICRLDGGDEA